MPRTAIADGVRCVGRKEIERIIDHLKDTVHAESQEAESASNLWNSQSEKHPWVQVLLVWILRCGSDSFQMFEIAQNITNLCVVANSLVFTTNPRMNILNVKLCITKPNVFYWGLYMLMSLLLGITQHTTITLNLFSEFKISIITHNYLLFFAKSFR